MPTADLQKDTSRIFKGGGYLWLIDYDAAKLLLKPYATVKTQANAGSSSVEVYSASTVDFGASGTLIFNVCGGATFTRAFSGLVANVFTTVTPLPSTLVVGAKLAFYSASVYAEASYKNVGHLAEEGTRFLPTVETEDVHNEQGDLVQVLFGKDSFQFQTNLLQSSKEELDFIFTESRDQFYAARYVVKLKNKGHQFWLFPKVQIVPMAEPVFGNQKRILAMTVKVLKDSVSGESWRLYEG